jgi:hypothetical protein
MAQLSKTVALSIDSLPQMNMGTSMNSPMETWVLPVKRISLWLFCLALACATWTQAAAATKGTGLMSVATTETELVVESSGGPVSYKAAVDRKKGGDIKQLCLPADGKPVTSDLDNFFFHGKHADEYTLRGWTARDQCILSSSVEVLSRKSEEIVVQVNIEAAGTYKVVAADPATKAKLAGKIKSYQEKTVKIKRLYAFRSDGIEVTDEVLWLYPGMEFNVIEWAATFATGTVQSPARLVKGPVKASFYPVGSGGEKVPQGISYPFTAENFLKNGWKVSFLTTSTSFELQKSDRFGYEKAWQTDWEQTSGFRYELPPLPSGKPVTVQTKILFAKATPAEMPPVITLRSPAWEARWLDEKGEVGKYKLGEAMKLLASAVNADGSPVADKDIAWEVRIDRWWKRPAVRLQGAEASCALPGAANDEEREIAQQKNLLVVIKVTAKGNNGTEATEHFAMLVAK